MLNRAEEIFFCRRIVNYLERFKYFQYKIIYPVNLFHQFSCNKIQYLFRYF